jgi:peptidyl-prolyl cis-trans isomerase SurA
LTPSLASALVALCALSAAGASAQGLRGSLPAPSTPASAASPAAAARTGDFIVAVVNSEPITNNEVNARVRRLQQDIAQRGGRVPAREAMLPEVLEALISERAQLQLARETGIKVDEAQVDEAQLSVARQNGIDVAELQRRLVQDGIGVAQFRRELRDQILLGRVREREVGPQVRVSDLDVDRFIEEQRAAAGAEALSLNLAQVLVVVPEDAKPEQVATLQRKAEAALARARAGEDFAKLARELSDAPDASRTGGQMGPADRYPQLFLDAVQGVAEGGVSAVVRSGAGFHVLKVVEKRTAGIGGATVVQTRARHILLRPSAQLSEAQARARLADLRQRGKVGRA